jgi:hypothetical protein
VKTESLWDVLLACLAIVADVNHLAHCETVTDALDSLEDIHAEISTVGGGVSELLIDEASDVVFVEHAHILSQNRTNKKLFLLLIKSFFYY